MEPEERRPDLSDADIERAVAEGQASIDSGTLITFHSEHAFREFLARATEPKPTTRQASTWLQSSYSPGGKQRVLVARLTDGSVLVGSAGNGVTLYIPQDEWIAFIKAVKNGEFEPGSGG